MRTTQMTHFFHLLFLLYLFVKFISEFEILKIHFQIYYFGPFWSVKYLNFLSKATDSDSSYTFLESRHPEVTKNLYYVLSTHQSQILIFLGSRWWTIFEVEENFIQSLSDFYYFFDHKKIAFKSPFWPLPSSIYYWILLICLTTVQNREKCTH